MTQVVNLLITHLVLMVPLVYSSFPNFHHHSVKVFYLNSPVSSVVELSHSAGQHPLPVLSDGYKWPVGCPSLADLAR